MGKQFPEISPKLRAFIEAQHVFFVATAARDGRVNVSPKGLDSLRVVDAHRVVWVNPHRGKAGYAPTQRGMAAVLPYVDSFLAGHSLATYADLMEVVAGA